MTYRTHWQPTANLNTLRVRAEVLTAMRVFFTARAVLEVTTPVLNPSGTVDPSIANLQLNLSALPNSPGWYLHTSPEFAMKRLLAAGSGPIYQICPVFRDNDLGRQHRPEFTLLEWYRPDFSYHQLMDEVESLIRHILDGIPHPSPLAAVSERLSYQTLFLRSLDLDPMTATWQMCLACCEQHAIPVPDNMGTELNPWLDLLLSLYIVPKLPMQQLTFVYDYPASQAALAQTRNCDNNIQVAERFELYWGQLELANGFQELRDADEQRRRFIDENRQRVAQAKPEVQIDERLLAALQAGLPNCAGVALGIERLLMALLGAEHINAVIAFSDEL